MKNLFTFLIWIAFSSVFYAQNSDGPGRKFIEPTAEIKMLEAQESQLKTKGDLKALAANRLAQVEAWQILDPETAAEFTPLVVDKSDNTSITGSSGLPEETEINSSQKYGTDLQINNFFINDGADLDTAQNGDIYAVSFVNQIKFGSAFDEIYIYKSTNNGLSFFLWGSANVPDEIVKMKLTLMDAGATKYLFTTYNSKAGNLKNLRFDMAGGPLMSETITTNVIDFDIDVDYEFVNAAQLYAVYIKGDNAIYSARSASNSTGFTWGDEHYFGRSAKECAFTYGKGNTFMSYIGYSTGNHYFAANSGFNNPGGWQAEKTLTTGAVYESYYISLRAERKPYSNFVVVSYASRRQTGSSNPLKGFFNVIKPALVGFQNMDATTDNVLHWDSWSKKVDNNTSIRASFVIQNQRTLNIINYNNGTFDTPTIISDHSVVTVPGSKAVAGDQDNNAIAIYVSAVVPTGLFFDSNRTTAGVTESSVSQVHFYPNPVKNYLNLLSKSLIEDVVIYNTVGQKVKNFTPNSVTTSLDLSTLVGGLYLMKVTSGGRSSNYKIIKR